MKSRASIKPSLLMRYRDTKMTFTQSFCFRSSQASQAADFDGQTDLAFLRKSELRRLISVHWKLEGYIFLFAYLSRTLNSSF